MNEWVWIVGQLLLGLVLLVGGGELLVRGASRVAATMGISPLVIGLTVVAFGTSAPELAVSLNAGLSGNPDIAAGNVIGSNIFNVLFILGLCALILPLKVSLQVVRREVPLMIGVSLLLLAFAWDGKVGLIDGLLLFGGLVIYTVWSIMASRKETAAAASAAGAPAETKPAGGKTAMQVGLMVVGLGILVVGADFLIESATAIARAFHVSDMIIGLTIVAAGTSLPEVATSVIATFRGERDIAIGNVVGSNIFNILGILGLSAIITPGGLNVNPAMVSFDLPIMVAVAVACLPIFFTGFSIARWEGALFFASYVAYTLFLILAAAKNPAVETLSNAVLLIAPLVVIVLGWTTFQAIRGDGVRGAK